MNLFKTLIRVEFGGHTHVHGLITKQVFQTHYLHFLEIGLRKFGLCLLDLDSIGFNT